MQDPLARNPRPRLSKWDVFLERDDADSSDGEEQERAEAVASPAFAPKRSRDAVIDDSLFG